MSARILKTKGNNTPFFKRILSASDEKLDSNMGALCWYSVFTFHVPLKVCGALIHFKNYVIYFSVIFPFLHVMFNSYQSIIKSGCYLIDHFCIVYNVFSLDVASVIVNLSNKFDRSQFSVFNDVLNIKKSWDHPEIVISIAECVVDTGPLEGGGDWFGLPDNCGIEAADSCNAILDSLVNRGYCGAVNSSPMLPLASIDLFSYSKVCGKPANQPQNTGDKCLISLEPVIDGTNCDIPAVSFSRLRKNVSQNNKGEDCSQTDQPPANYPVVPVFVSHAATLAASALRAKVAA
jgi:hypothetical protein